MAITAIHKLVRAACEPAFGRVLARGEPGYQTREVEDTGDDGFRRIEDAEAGESAEDIGAMGFGIRAACDTAFEGLTWGCGG